jgi:hypothetical protein
MATAPSSSTATLCDIATGASLTGVTSMDTRAGADTAPASSVTVNVNESAPLKSASGVYWRFGAVPVSVPLSGEVATAWSMIVPSASVPAKVMFTDESSATVAVSSVATGVWLTGTVGPASQLVQFRSQDEVATSAKSSTAKVVHREAAKKSSRKRVLNFQPPKRLPEVMVAAPMLKQPAVPS